MATLKAATTSDGAQVSDRNAVLDLLDEYVFPGLHVEVDDDGTISIWGYSTLDLYRVTEEGDPDETYGIVKIEFLARLSTHLADGEELIVQCAGYTKCRFPVHAVAYRITPGTVEETTLNSGWETRFDQETEGHPDEVFPSEVRA